MAEVEIIRARTKDSAAVLIDRLMKSKNQTVVLMLPKNSIIAANLETLRALREEAESIDKKLFINTENEDIKAFAKELGLPFFEQKQELKRMLDVVPIRKIEIQPEIERAMEIESTEEQKEQKEDSELEKSVEDFYNETLVKKEDSIIEKAPFFNRLVLFFLCISVALASTALYLILPRANIKITLNKLPIKESISVAVSKNVNSIDFANSIIPGQYFLLTKSGSKTIDNTNTDDATSLKTGGMVDIYNAYSAAPQKLVAQTRFETKDGKIFRIQKTVIVPGARMSGPKLSPASIKAGVVSDGTGESYLLAPSYFTIPGFEGSPKYAGFYAKSAESMSYLKGGNAVANAAIEKTKKELENTLANDAENDILNTLKNSDLKLIDGASAVTINDWKVNGSTLSMQLSLQAVLFKESDLKKLIEYSISNKYRDLKNFKFEGDMVYSQATKSDYKKGETFFTFDIDKDNIFAVDISNLKKEVMGLDKNSIRDVVSNKNFVNNATIYLWPFWVKQAPNNPNKINISLDK